MCKPQPKKKILQSLATCRQWVRRISTKPEFFLCVSSVDASSTPFRGQRGKDNYFMALSMTILIIFDLNKNERWRGGIFAFGESGTKTPYHARDFFCFFQRAS